MKTISSNLNRRKPEFVYSSPILRQLLGQRQCNLKCHHREMGTFPFMEGKSWCPAF